MKDLSLTAPWSQEKQRLIWKGLMLTWSQWGSVRGHDWVAGPARWPLWWPAFFFTGAFFLACFTSSALAYILQNHSRHQMLPQLVFVHWVTRERERRISKSTPLEPDTLENSFSLICIYFQRSARGVRQGETLFISEAPRTSGPPAGSPPGQLTCGQRELPNLKCISFLMNDPKWTSKDSTGGLTWKFI